MQIKNIIQLGSITTIIMALNLSSFIAMANDDNDRELTDNETFLELEITDHNNEVISKTLVSNNNEFTYFSFNDLKIGVFSKVFGENNEHIYNEFSVKQSNDESKELAHPSITTYNNSWGSFKIEDNSKNSILEIKIKATSNIAQDKLKVAVDKFITEKEKPFWQKYNDSFDTLNGEDC